MARPAHGPQGYQSRGTLDRHPGVVWRTLVISTDGFGTIRQEYRRVCNRETR